MRAATLTSVHVTWFFNAVWAQPQFPFLPRLLWPFPFRTICYSHAPIPILLYSLPESSTLCYPWTNTGRYLHVPELVPRLIALVPASGGLDTSLPPDTTNHLRQYSQSILFMSGLGERLERLGLAQYHDVFVAEGFDTWETVLDITESDLLVHQLQCLHLNADINRNALNVKLGHRRVCCVFWCAVDVCANVTLETSKSNRRVSRPIHRSPSHPSNTECCSLRSRLQERRFC